MPPEATFRPCLHGGRVTPPEGSIDSPRLHMFVVVCSWREYDSNLITLNLTLLRG